MSSFDPTREAEGLRSSYDAVYLSPHLDDVVLSCGGRIHDRATGGQAVLVVTVGAGDEPGGWEELSPLARILHRAWRLDRPDPEGPAGDGVGAVARRRAEDRTACRLLEAEALHWDFLEAIYRRDAASGEPFYGELADLFGPLPPDDRPTVLAVAERLVDLPPHRELLVPLGVGGHVDHRIARQAAEQRFGSHLTYYEEYPYSRSRRAVRRVGPGIGWTRESVPVTRGGIEAKIRAASAYRSQVKTLFGGRRRLRWKLRRHLRKLGGESVWRWEGS